MWVASSVPPNNHEHASYPRLTEPDTYYIMLDTRPIYPVTDSSIRLIWASAICSGRVLLPPKVAGPCNGPMIAVKR